ncbi:MULTISPECIES: hypothetical protein [Roseobacteraceae]|uniref:hypothetical protein n=1 Tax=Roseobacteraceae TaxID=2854170 RepID=UPI000B809E52|nr:MULTISPECIES: hypothetical protein [Roseobacteraceae]
MSEPATYDDYLILQIASLLKDAVYSRPIFKVLTVENTKGGYKCPIMLFQLSLPFKQAEAFTETNISHHHPTDSFGFHCR